MKSLDEKRDECSEIYADTCCQRGHELNRSTFLSHSQGFDAGVAAHKEMLLDPEFKEPYYTGRGDHSIYQLEESCEKYKEFCYQKQLKIQQIEERLKEAEKIVKWYADKKNWVCIRDRECPSGFFYSCTDDSDEEPMNPKDEDDERVIGGKLARQYMEKVK